MKRLAPILVLLCWLARAGRADTVFSFDASQNVWTLSNGVIGAVFELTQNGIFQLDQIGLSGGQAWLPPAGGSTSPVRFAWNDRILDGTTQFVLVEQHTETIDRGGERQVITLQDAGGAVQVQVALEMYTGQATLRWGVTLTNLTSSPGYVTLADMAPMQFSDQGAPFQTFRVDQWAVVPHNLDFETIQSTLNSNGEPLSVLSGAQGAQVSWIAVRDASSRGMFAGWEFNGRSAATLSNQGPRHTLQFSAPVDDIHHLVTPGASFAIPNGFLGFFQGGWDEAGYRTQRFVEAALARPAPDLQRFPYMSYDSWGLQEQFDESVLRRNAAIAAQLGVELFIVDLGWANQLGNWHPDPVKFPNGLKAFSDYVHALGMKFGLHLTPAEVDPNSPIVIANPDWTSTESDNYFGAVSLCLSHAPVRTWVTNEILRVIDDYNVDWILQDGQNMVKSCTKTTHTHDPLDSNYSNAVQGIDAVVEEVQRQRPNVSWENCENGGNMMTFKMVQDYVTSITNDASGALASRQGLYGASYVFTPRFADRYSPEDPVNSYNTRSYMFGGPWHLMNQLDTMTPDGLAFASSEIDAYKQMRGVIRRGQVFHLTAAPANGRIDAIESSYLGSAIVAVVTRDGGDADSFILKLKGTTPAALYTVRFQTDPRILSMTGQQLEQDGVLVSLPAEQSAEVVYAGQKPTQN